MTLHEQVIQCAKNMARASAERALSRDWHEHPMFGIEKDTDQWAAAYQAALSRLQKTLEHFAADQL
jgi:hypothetical protein